MIPLLQNLRVLEIFYTFVETFIMKYLTIILNSLFWFSCSNYQVNSKDLKTPDLAEILYSEIEFLNKEQHILFLDSTHNLDSLEDELRMLVSFDIDSVDLKKYETFYYDCNELQRKMWKGDNSIISISTFKTKIDKNNINLVRISINKEKINAELLTIESGPLEYLKVNKKVYNPVYESRIVGLNESIKLFKSKICK